MTAHDQELRRRAYEEVEKKEPIANSDPHRQHFHIMPPVGLLNDPNGVIYWKGSYHVFFQWQPFQTGHGAKFWGHYTTQDVVNWKREEIALAPSDWFDKNGCYSGSAVTKDDRLYLFYTGNVRDQDGNRETYQCLAVSDDGLSFEKKGVVARLPEGYTPHFRDPKVWEHEGTWYMVVGAQTENMQGHAVLFASDNLTEWRFLGPITGAGFNELDEFGYMWECPDLFSLQGSDVLIVSPQGLETDGFRYQNVYQSGYFVGRLDYNKPELKHGGFTELDQGFDFYAPQTLEDDQGRRILFAWMAVPDQDEGTHPTIDYHWIHCMTLPRQLTLSGQKLIQQPLPELKAMRRNEKKVQINMHGSSGTLPVENPEKAEILIEDIDTESGFSISIRGTAAFSFHKDEGIVTLERTSFDGKRTEARHCCIKDLHTVHMFIDASSVEIFVNNGEEVFSARYFPFPGNHEVTASSTGKSEMNVGIWTLM
ncbi:sucrose-6-phosphate hydrolase [Bacillus inaquosorum]|uniref:sucrose-6-phosphate hydrolase n=1 Tax=Bacillus inaquosorum TaxID=483913 RepID=UPI0002EDC7B1|nr:sucrose-6-phosphate hydrolase [Bacillus inaquosorum]MED4646537.1 sucrose-6-phosphate hydrolase [Bacillus inaquosorum]MED4789522.1 sucrose-6-phosphate hydrolase [Bacillus inaquosorum]